MSVSLTYSDNIDVDIVGANLYQKYLKHYNNNTNGSDSDSTSTSTDTEGYSIPACRQPPLLADEILPSTIEVVRSVLVRTGVSADTANLVNHSHREFATEDEKLRKPTAVVDNVLQAMEYIMLEEHM